MNVRLFLRLVINTARTTFAYRVGFVLGTFGTTFQLVAMVAVWNALLAGGAHLGGFSLTQMKAYLLVGYVTGVLGTGLGEHVMSDRIRSGQVALDLVKPANYQAMRFAETLGGLGVEIGLIIAVGSAFLLFAGPVVAPVHLGLFVVSLLAVIPTKFLIVYLSTLLCFWTQNYHGVTWARSALSLVLSGALVPLALLPGWAQALAQALPFAGITSTPALIFAGRVESAHALVLVAVQYAWVVALWFAAQRAWQVAVRQLTVHGG